MLLWLGLLFFYLVFTCLWCWAILQYMPHFLIIITLDTALRGRILVLVLIWWEIISRDIEWWMIYGDTWWGLIHRICQTLIVLDICSHTSFTAELLDIYRHVTCEFMWSILLLSQLFLLLLSSDNLLLTYYSLVLSYDFMLNLKLKTVK